MKKSTKIALIVACVLIVVGAMLAYFPASRKEFWQSGWSSETFTQHQYDFTEPTEKIFVDEVSSSVIFSISPDDAIHITVTDTDHYEHVVTHKNGTLRIEYVDTADHWYDHVVFNFNMKENLYDVFIEVPQNLVAGLDITTVSGDIELPVLEATTAKLSTVSGEIEAESLTAARVDAETVSGEIEMDLLRADTFHMETVSGDIDLVLAVPQDIAIDTISGEITAPRIIAGAENKLETVSGDITVTTR